jgi:hypothetical protein
LYNQEDEHILNLNNLAQLHPIIEGGEVWVAGVEGGQAISSVALWWPPGVRNYNM